MRSYCAFPLHCLCLVMHIFSISLRMDDLRDDHAIILAWSFYGGGNIHGLFQFIEGVSVEETLAIESAAKVRHL